LGGEVARRASKADAVWRLVAIEAVAEQGIDAGEGRSLGGDFDPAGGILDLVAIIPDIQTGDEGGGDGFFKGAGWVDDFEFARGRVSSRRGSSTGMPS
jgi:hypothetical protein